MRTQYVDTALRVGHVSIIDVITATSWHSAPAVSAAPAPVTETWFQHSQCIVQQRLRNIHPASTCCAHGTIVGRRECSVVGYIQPALVGCAASGLVVEDQLSVRRFRVEGQLFSVRCCSGMFQMTCSRQRTSSRLYVRRVFKMDTCVELVPERLKCVEDVFDSEDLPLNTSRETLHQHTLLRVVERHLVRPCLDMFAELAMQNYEHLKVYTNSSGCT